MVKLSAKKNTYEWVRKGLNDAINSDGTVNRFMAFKTLASFYQVMLCIEEKPDISDEELPDVMEKAAKKAAIHILVVNELTKKGDTTVKDELKTIFDGLKYHIYCDIYGNELSDDTSKIKICIKHGTGSMTERLRSYVKRDGTVDNPKMVISQFVN
ncbi:MAG: hypothetical protein K6G68_07040 [Oscillospiraceae bacterium]|nr:hypothetical protein [Oscillospiraceae bacterium]